MNILLATGIYPPESGGPATYTAALAKALLKRGHRVTIVTYGESPPLEVKRSTKTESPIEDVVCVSRKGGPLVRYARYAKVLYKQAKTAEVIFAQGAVSEGVPATLVAKWLGKKICLRIPGDYAWEMGMQIDQADTEASLDKFLNHRHFGRVRIYEWLERWTARSAWSLIAPSQYLKSVSERWGVPTERIEVIKNAVQELPATEGRIALRKRFKVESKVVCLTAVRAVPWKGVADLVTWWHRLPKTHVLVVAGDGPELSVWKKIAEQEEVMDRVRFVGRLPQVQLTEWYDAADVFVLHTGYEGYPHTIPEAVSRGLPCFVSDQGGNPETQVEFGEMVQVLPYQDRDAWLGALQSTGIRDQLDRPSQAEHVWSHEDMVEKVETHLHNMTSVHQGATRVVMVGYERELVKTESETFKRVASLASASLSISAVVLSHLPQDVELERDHLHVYAFAGSFLRRLWLGIYNGICEAKRLPSRTLISGQDPFTAGCVAYLVSRWTNQPLEIQEHGDFWSGAWVKERWLNRVWSWLGILILRRAERVRVVSERVKSHLVSRGVNEGKIEVIPVAQDLEKLLAMPVSSHNEGSIFTFVAPCRFVPQKGLDILIKACQLMKERGESVRVICIGSGPLEPWLKEEIQKQQLAEMMSIQTWSSPDELWEGADGLVLPSNYEGWGRTIVEAMAAGVSIVATDVGCAGSFFRPGIDGLVVPVGDAQALSEAMVKTVQDSLDRELRKTNARERAKEFLTREELHDKQRAGWRALIQKFQSISLRPRFELWVWAFVMFAVLTRVASVVLFHGQLANREWGFYTLVDRWFHGYGYSFASELGCSSAYRSPGYLFFLTALYTFFSPSNTWAQAIVQNIFVVGALWMTYVVGKRLVDPRAALVGGFIMACYPYTFYHYTQYYHTFLQSFFLLIVVWCVLRLEDTKRLKYAVYGGLSIGSLAYVQGTILPATPLISLWILWRLWPEWKRAVLAVGIMAVLSAGLIAPWTYRNWTVFHQFVPLTTDLGHALFKANNENIYEITKRGYPQEIIEDVASSTNPLFKQYRLPISLEMELRASGVFHDSVLWTQWHPKEPNGSLVTCSDRGLLDEYQFNQYWLGKTEEFWHTHPEQAWKLPLQKMRTFWQPGLFPSVKTGAPWSFAGNPTKEWLARSAVWGSTALVIVLGWAGIFIFLYRRDRKVWIPFMLFVIFTILHSLIAGYTKYRIPLDHLMAAYAGWVLVAIWDRVRCRRVV